MIDTTLEQSIEVPTPLIEGDSSMPLEITTLVAFVHTPKTIR